MSDATIEHVLWVCGPDAVGKTTAAWEVYQRVVGRGILGAYLDTDYLGFCEPLPEGDPAALVAANLSSMAANFAAVGARVLVVSGILYSSELRARYEAALPGAIWRVCRLSASEETLTERIVCRGIAEGAGGDGAVSGHTIEALRERGRQAGEFAARLDRSTFADVVVQTDGISVVQVADRVLEALPDWPTPCR